MHQGTGVVVGSAVPQAALCSAMSAAYGWVQCISGDDRDGGVMFVCLHLLTHVGDLWAGCLAGAKAAK